MDIGIGVVELVVGICIIVWPAFFVLYLYMILGIFILITGFNDITEANRIRKAGLGNWKVALLFGILTLIAGTLAVISPFALVWAEAVITGIALLFDGITEIVAGIRLPKEIR